MKPVKYRDTLVFTAIACIIVLSFFPLFNAGFLDWDDLDYVTNNASVHSFSFDNLKAYFSTSYLGNYHPLTMLSYLFDYLAGKGQPFLFHATNIVLHIFNSWLVYRVVKSISDSTSMAVITALLFAVHPLAVESVGWIAERKNLLYTFFFLVSALYYIRYLATEHKKFYWLCLFCFLLSLLSKGQAVTLPLTLLALGWLIKKQFFSKLLLRDLLPFFVLSVVFGIIAVLSQHKDGYVNTAINTTLVEKISVAAYSYTGYIFKTLVPLKLSAFYPFPKTVSPGLLLYLVPVLGILGLFIYAVKKQMYVLSAIIFMFTSNIIFVIQVLPLGGFICADRYTYIPSICIFILIAYALSLLLNSKYKIISIISCTLILTGCSVMTFNRSKTFTDTRSFLSAILTNYPDDEVTLNSMAALLSKKGDYQNALVYSNKATQSDPNYFQAYFNKGLIYNKLNDPKHALESFEKCVSLEPGYYEAYYGIAQLMIAQNSPAEALQNLNKVIALKNDYKQAYYLRGLCFAFLKQYEEAITNYNKAQELGLNSELLFTNRAITYGETGNFNKAMSDLDAAIAINPRSAQCFYLRGIARFRSGTNGCNDLLQAKQLGFTNAENALSVYCK
jgi:Flp pilus assembly protein TadD